LGAKIGNHDQYGQGDCTDQIKLNNKDLTPDFGGQFNLAKSGQVLWLGMVSLSGICIFSS
jgi:hypothetical protein